VLARELQSFTVLFRVPLTQKFSTLQKQEVSTRNRAARAEASKVDAQQASKWSDISVSSSR
jgi:hypothetical protein